jgi:Carboxypeptidase regulatory-like domain
VIVGLLFLPLKIDAQHQIVELADVQLAKFLSAVVQDHQGSPLTNVLVQELSPDWKTVWRTSTTNNHGRFSLATVQRRKIYYLQLSTPGFDPLRVRVQVDRKRGASLKLRLMIAT